ncbi:HIT family protein [Coralloluteibacterium thermophilus]|uniref:HIT family protein n=1 Tax=Coralloluteibacterium thermophilum TaxID=2707049 RepID=A0ABV9NM64_9GAMM
MSGGPTHTDCIFCGIAEGRLPASIVHRDAHWLAVMDIHPIRAGHVLILPKRHVGRIAELEPAAQRRLFALADAVLRAQEAEGLAAGGGNLLLNDGVAANQHIPHLHLHCIPRRRGDTAAFGLRLLARTVGLFGPRAERARLDALAGALAARVRKDAAVRTEPEPGDASAR